MVTRAYEVRGGGCQMNVHDSERIAGLLDEAGHAPVADDAQPDVVVFSTCAVRENADNKLAGTSATSSRSSTARPACRSPSACVACSPRWQGMPLSEYVRCSRQAAQPRSGRCARPFRFGVSGTRAMSAFGTE
jgi:hypothetical protein